MNKKVKRVVVAKETPTEAPKLKVGNEAFIFGSKNFKFMLLGIGLIGLGMILMLGGHMPSPDVWDESLIYSPVRTVISPIVILSGIAMQFFAIFAKNS